MMNIYFSKIEITGNKSEISELFSKMKEWTSKNYRENDFGNRWLGNLLIGAGIYKTEDFDGERKKIIYNCRGKVVDFSLQENTLFIKTETIWVPMIKMFDAICIKHLSEYNIDFTSEDWDKETYISTLDDYIDNYHIDYIGNRKDLDSIYCATNEETIDFINKFLNTDENNLEILFEKLEKYHNEEKNKNKEYVNIHKWEKVKIYDVD